MLINLTLVIQDRKTDIQVNREQRVQDTLEILKDSGRVPWMGQPTAQIVHSMRRRERINAKLTYEQAHIYTGDILYLEQQNRRINEYKG